MTLAIKDNNPFLNIFSIINGQLLSLIKIIKANSSNDIPDLDININLQVYSLKKIEDKKRSKKFFSLCLNDNLFKYGRFILMESELSNQLQIGYIINITKINYKRVTSGLYIMIKDFSIIKKGLNELPNVKLLIENEKECFIDEDGNNVEEIKKNINNKDT